MTKVDLETLEALHKLGRRHWWPAATITNRRLHTRYLRGPGRERWNSLEPTRRPAGLTNREYAQYIRGTKAALARLVRAELVERHVQHLAAGRMLFYISDSPLFRINKAGRVALKKANRR
jgi:hypothetical protein